MVVTVSAVLIINVFSYVLLAFSVSRPSLEPQELAASAKSMAASLSRPLSASPADAAALTQVLAPLLGNRMSAAVTNRKANVLVSVPEWSGAAGKSLFAQAPAQTQVLARAALTGSSSPERVSAKDAEGNALAVVPVLGPKQQVLGLLFVKVEAPIGTHELALFMAQAALTSVLLVGAFAAVVGLGFGFFTARQLTRRLKAISDAADAWSQGEFSTVASDDSDDELGQLARRLNHMAMELRELVVLRQNLATAEERNHLSRELHDTVKQQVFATTMQVGAARVLLDRDIDLARARLAEGERLATEAQHELTAILEQLRPGSYVRKPEPTESLEAALRDYLSNWSRQGGIDVQVLAEPIPALPAASQQALLRIAQESLANVWRHSQATKVTVQLGPAHQEKHEAARAGVMLAVTDNGRGFDSSRVVGGLGLRSMRERAEALPQGQLMVQSQVGQGTHIEVRCIL